MKYTLSKRLILYLDISIVLSSGLIDIYRILSTCQLGYPLTHTYTHTHTNTHANTNTHSHTHSHTHTQTHTHTHTYTHTSLTHIDWRHSQVWIWDFVFLMNLFFLRGEPLAKFLKISYFGFLFPMRGLTGAQRSSFPRYLHLKFSILFLNT